MEVLNVEKLYNEVPSCLCREPGNRKLKLLNRSSINSSLSDYCYHSLRIHIPRASSKLITGTAFHFLILRWERLLISRSVARSLALYCFFFARRSLRRRLLIERALFFGLDLSRAVLTLGRDGAAASPSMLVNKC